MSTARFNDPKAPAAALHRLTNGRYELLISDSGAGQSSCNGIALNRWRNDPVQDDLGSIIYLRDLDTGRYWSLGYQPTRTSTGRYRAGLDGERFAVEREDEGIEARLAVSIDAHADLERRRVRLRNLSTRARRLELTSYLEVVLFPADADAAHPAFAKLFVQTERDPESGALLARRRPRAQHEAWPWMIHALAGVEPTEWESDRARFLGRGRTPASPAALLGDGPLSGTVGNVLDPVLSLRTVVELAPGEEVETLFLTGVAPDRAGALRLGEPDIRLMRAGGRRACSPAVSPGGSPPAGADDGAAVDGLLFFNGYGGFSADGTEYVIRLPWGRDAPRRPPQPWINVIANERCGLLVSESGSGYTWARNSQANRLTPWGNDPVSDPHGESCYIRDEDSGAAWSPTPGPMPAPCDYEVRHGLGYSRFACDYSGLTQEIMLFVPRADPVRILRLRLTNTGVAPRTLSVFSYQRLVLGGQPGSPSPVVTAFDAGRDLLTAVNPEAGDFAGGIAFAFSVVAGVEVEGSAVSGDRLAFIGRHGDPSSPAALRPGAELDAACGRGLEPCFAQQVRIRLASGESAECAFLLGECLGEAELDELVGRYRVPGAVGAALAEATGFWADLVSRTRVETPSPAIDLMLNGWLQYQNLGCRIWARSAFYQSGGAYGYRDQLQDAAALVYLRPDLTRAQILLHAGNQFVEGDVLHWWHPAPMGRGLRTRFSDDLLWLPFVTGHYVQVTGDEALLDEPALFLAARALAPGEDEAYLLPEPSGESADVYEHCCRAIDRSLTRGAHGLPLMGTGDWNDGMNRVGREGRGESVWLGFFLFQILGDFIALCERREDATRVARYAEYRENLGQALQAQAWDGAWYRRAYYDDGTPLGCDGDAECRIDALAQSWAVISGAVPRDRAERAIDALETELVSEADGIIRLLTPPFVDTPHDPGYIKGYVAGVRENGGQYTHAACWAVMAMARLGRAERAARLLEMLTPISHSASRELADAYRVEPYAVAADVYGEPPHVGRGGWSWYTGSAGWMYRVALESVLGLSVENGRTLVIRPCIPADWPGFRIRHRLLGGETLCDILIENPNRGRQPIAARLDGQVVPVTDGAVRVVLATGLARCRIEVRLG